MSLATLPRAILWLLTSVNWESATGALIDLNLFPNDLPRNPPYPCIVYRLVSAPRGYTMQGQDGATPFRFQFDLMAATAAELWALQAAMLADLSGFKGIVPVSPPVRIQGIFADNETDSAEGELEAPGPRVATKSMDFMIWTKE
jgi:hypothetical protein